MVLNESQYEIRKIITIFHKKVRKGLDFPAKTLSKGANEYLPAWQQHQLHSWYFIDLRQ